VLILPWDETFDVGADTGTPVYDKTNQVPFKFTGKLNKPTLSIERPKLAPEDNGWVPRSLRREVAGARRD
jgi:hypothetical protein